MPSARSAVDQARVCTNKRMPLTTRTTGNTRARAPELGSYFVRAYAVHDQPERQCAGHAAEQMHPPHGTLTSAVV